MTRCANVRAEEHPNRLSGIVLLVLERVLIRIGGDLERRVAEPLRETTFNGTPACSANVACV